MKMFDVFEVEERLFDYIARQFTKEELQVILRYNKLIGEEIRKEQAIQREKEILLNSKTQKEETR